VKRCDCVQRNYKLHIKLLLLLLLHLQGLVYVLSRYIIFLSKIAVNLKCILWLWANVHDLHSLGLWSSA